MSGCRRREWSLSIGLVFMVACSAHGGADAGGIDASGRDGGAAPGSCNAIAGGCECHGAVSTAGICNRDSQPGALLTCCATPGTDACSCTARPYAGPWTCGSGGSGSACTCFPEPTAVGTTLASCTGPLCVWSSAHRWCACDVSAGGSQPPDAHPVPSCTEPPGPALMRGSCPAGTTQVFSCDGTQPPSCDPAVCHGTSSAGGVTCYEGCEGPNGEVSSGPGTSCVEHCN